MRDIFSFFPSGHLSVVLNQERLVDFSVVHIDDRAIGLLEVADEVLKHPNLYFKPRLFFVLLRISCTILKKTGSTFAIFSHVDSFYPPRSKITGVSELVNHCKLQGVTEGRHSVVSVAK